MERKESKSERDIRQALEAQLDTNEELLGYTTGKIAELIARPYYIGLTTKRLILMPLGRLMKVPSGEVYSIRREIIRSLKWLRFFSMLQINLLEDSLSFGFRGHYSWEKQAKALVDLIPPTAASPPVDMASAKQQHLQQAHDLQKLGVIALAQREANAALQADLTSDGADSPAVAMQKQLSETRLALRVGAAFLFANVTIVLSAIPGDAWYTGEFLRFDLIMALVANIWLGVNLWRGWARGKAWGLPIAALGFINLGLIAVLSGLFLEVIVFGALVGGFVIALTGKSTRVRTLVAVAIYVLGYLGFVAFVM